MAVQGGILIFSRMNSSRLPGKALLSLGGMPLVERVYKRALSVGYPVYLATSSSDDDIPLVEWALQNNVPCFKGDKNNVLKRAVDACDYFKLSYFARLCGDRPLFNVEEMKQSLLVMGSSIHFPTPPDIVSNHLFGKRVPGLMTEVIKKTCLENIQIQASLNEHYTEHLSAYIYDHPEMFNIFSTAKSNIDSVLSSYAIDTPNDWLELNSAFLVNNDPCQSIEHFNSIVNLLKKKNA